MSISTKNTAPADEEFKDVVYEVPGDKEDAPPAADSIQKKETFPENKPEQAPEKVKAEENQQPSPDSEKKKDAQKSEQSGEQKKTEDTPEKSESSPEKEAKKGKENKNSWMDISLVAALLLLLGGGGWFVYSQMAMYDVPSPYEEAKAEHERLQNELKAIRGDKNDRHARMNVINKSVELIRDIQTTEKAIKDAKNALKQEQESLAALDASIARTKEAIDAGLYELRTTDKDCRAKAISELTGLPIGDAVNKRKRDKMESAIIHRIDLDKKLITFRSETGQVTWPIKDLVTKDLPVIVRYALEMEDLVDMSVLEGSEAPGEKTVKRPVAQRTPKKATAESAEDYDPTPGAPVINSKPGETISTDGGLAPEESSGAPTWDAPAGDLPI